MWNRALLLEAGLKRKFCRLVSSRHGAAELPGYRRLRPVVSNAAGVVGLDGFAS
jgi:hypothetical protein